MTTTKQEVKKEIVPVAGGYRPEPGGILLPSSSDEKILEAFKRYQDLKAKLLEQDDYTHFVKWQLGDGKPNMKGFPLVADADKFAAEQKTKNFIVTQERRIKKSGVLKLGKAFCVSVEIVSESIQPAGAVYRVRASASNGQFAERTGSCDRTEKGRNDSPFDHILAIALTRATNRATMALLGGEITAEEVQDDPAFDGKVVTTNVVAVETKQTEAKRPEQKTEAELKADLDRKFNEKKEAKPTTERNLHLRRLFSAAKKAGLTEAQLRLKMKEAYNVVSTKDLSDTDLWGFVMGVEELAKIR
jgi:hypothetical protein